MIETLGLTKDGAYPNLAEFPRRMRAYNALAAGLRVIRRAFERIAEKVENVEWKFTYCNDCGEHLYYGRTCRQVLGPSKVTKK